MTSSRSDSTNGVFSGSTPTGGDGINGITAGLRRLGRIEFVQVRHEGSAAFASCAHVRYGGGPIGVCLATSGPGAIHLLNGLYDAKLDREP